MKDAMSRYKFLLLAVSIGVFALLAHGRAFPKSASGPATDSPEVIAVTFSSAWCASCKILKPRLARVIPAYEDKPIQFLDLDFTLGRKKALRRTAVQYGFEAIFDELAGATGFTLLIDHDTGEIIDTITANYSEKAMHASLSAAFAIAARTPSDES
ncbi:MAG: thioredoxin [Parvularculaceae bacterium]|nr:MAG: thioredoxin [Parvularculaceae bacterium]